MVLALRWAEGGLVARDTNQCAAVALCLNSRYSSAWDTLGTILGPEGSITTDDVPVTQYTPIAARRKFLDEFPQGGSLGALDCFERHLSLKLSQGRSPHCAFLHCGLVLAHRNESLGTPPTNAEIYFQPATGILDSRFVLHVSSLPPQGGAISELSKVLADRLSSPTGCPLSEQDCYVLALAFDEEDTLVTMLTSLAHRQRSTRFLNCVSSFLSHVGHRIVRKYSS